jgi:3-methylfumaryl-CoA hydratase
MTELSQNIDVWRQWIGRSERATDVVTPELVRRFNATFGLAGGHAEGDLAPALIHWCLAPSAVPASGLGADGHPEKGGFLPPIDLPRRMWAGSELNFVKPLLIGQSVTRNSIVADVTEKTGKSGRLCFVTVSHDVSVGGDTVLHETQNIVYKQSSIAPSSISVAVAPRGAVHDSVDANSTLLFRYSALTFNGHRIHYDRPYAINEEHYSGLVVHGPLQANLLFNLATRVTGSAPKRFAFKGVSPAVDGPLILNAGTASDNKLPLWTASPNGPVAMQAEASW